MLGRLPLLLLVLSLATAGCLGADPGGVDPATSDADAAASGGNPASPGNVTTWNLTDSTPMGWAAGVGVPGRSGGVVWTDECPEATFDVPGNATKVTVSVAGDAVNTSRPGAGEYQLRITEPDGDASAYDRQDGTTQSFNGPATGTWTLYMEPIGANANQAHVVTVVVDGASSTAPAQWGGLQAQCGG